MSDPTVEIIERPCPEDGCTYVATGPAKGPGSVGFKIGTHRSSVHGYRNPNPKRKRTGKPAPLPGEEDSKPVLLKLVESATGEIDTRSKRAPTEEELTKAGARFIGTLSVGAASYMAESDPTMAGEADRDALTDYLSLTPAEARDIAYPFARAMSRSKLNAKYGRSAVDNIDVASAMVELAMVGVRWRRYIRERDRRIQQGLTTRGPAGPGIVIDVGATMGPPSPAPTTAATAEEDALAHSNGFPHGGVIVTPEMLHKA